MNYLIIQFSNAAIDSHKPVKCRVENINFKQTKQWIINNGVAQLKRK